MPELQAQRRLVKSPPELWAEVSDAASLARHLGEVGEITITRAEPESTVAWEGERASGTVRLEPAGWGTKVTLTAQPSGDVPEAAVVAEPEPTEPAAAVPAPEPAAVVPEPAAAEPEPPTPAGRPSFLRRLFGRRAPEPGAAASEPAPPVEPEPVPAAVVAEPEPAAASEPAPPVEPEPVPAAVATEPEPQAAVQPAGDGLQAALAAALDSLGAAHHRPFSRG
jgi:hypothetical protein